MHHWLPARLFFVAAGVAAISSVFVSSSCTIFDGLVPDIPDARAEASIEDDGCQHKVPARRPPSMRGGGGPSWMVAARSIRFSTEDGFDLDDRCTCAPHDSGRCTPPASASTTLECDGDGGVDNTWARLTMEVRAIVDFEGAVNRDIGKGTFSILFRVEDYNGTGEDDAIKVSVFRSLGPVRDGGVDGPSFPPSFTPAEEWLIDRDSVVAESPLEATEYAEGYVVEGNLVARMVTPLTLHRGFDILLTSGVLSAKIVRDADRWRLDDVVVAGRWLANNAVSAVGRLEVEQDDGAYVPLCKTEGGMGLWEGVRSGVCAVVDVVESRDKDGDNERCNAISVGARLQTVPIGGSPRLDSPRPLPTCPRVLTCDR